MYFVIYTVIKRYNLKQFLIRIIRSLPVDPVHQETLLFFFKMGYWPNFESPRTFNEKINWRKLHSTSPLMVQCTDKIAVRDHVAERIGKERLIPLIYVGDTVTGEQLHALGDDIVAKPSHDSKSTEIIRENSPEVANEAAARLQFKLKTDYGNTTNQFVYSSVQPRILVEKMLVDERKGTPDDYKIFCFRQPDGSTKMFIETHEFREQPGYRIAWFDEELEPIDLRGSEYRTRSFPCPEQWPQMRAIAGELSREFDHVRIDLYHAEDKIFFGEMTFLDGGGRTEYSRAGGKRHNFDRELGDLWSLDLQQKNENLSLNSLAHRTG